MTETGQKGCSAGGRRSIYIQKVKGFFVKGYLEEEIFKGGTGLCWNYERIQSIFNKKAQSSTVTGRSWLLIEFVAWWGNFGQIALVQVSDMVKRSVSLSEINFAMAGYLLCIDLMFA